MANAHAEIGVIQQAYDANLTQGKSMSIVVRGEWIKVSGGEKMMLNDDDNAGASVRRIELLWRDKKSESSIAERLFDPTLTKVKEVVEMVFLNGGFVQFRISPDEFGLLATLSMDAQPGYFRMTALLNGLEGSKEFMEWVDGISGKEPVVILDHPWESQTICYDVATALDIFGRVLNDVCIPIKQLPEFSLS